MTLESSTKSELRAQFKARRKAVPDSEQLGHTTQLLDVFLNASSVQSLSPTAGYIASHQEADPSLIVEHLFNKKNEICLPKTIGNKEMVFYKWNIQDALTEGPFGIPEPALTTALIPKLILVPLLAFDAEGYRLGYGGGYYDRTLSRPEYAKSIRLGVAYAFQRTESLPRDTHDVRLHAALTEKGIEWFC